MKVGRILLFLSLLVCFSLNAWAQVDPLALFVKGNYAYKDGKYEEAVQAYESILKNNEATGAVYYNLGNSYFKLGKIGKAILNYERARQIIPRDSDLISNYEYALSLTKRFREAAPEGGNEEYKPTLLEKCIERVNNSFTLDEVTMILFLLIVIAGTMYLLALWLKWPRTFSRAALVVIFLIFFAYGYLFSVKITQMNEVVAVEETPARFEPREDATPYFNLTEGSKVELLRTEGNWAKIKRPDGKLGWVKNEAVEKIN